MLARAGGARRAALRVVACKLRAGGALQPLLVRGLAASPLYAPPTSAAFRSHTCYDVKDVPAGQSVRLTGWVNNLREMGGIMFVTLRDAYGLVQLTTDDGEAPPAAQTPRRRELFPWLACGSRFSRAMPLPRLQPR